MEPLLEFLTKFVSQLQSPTLAFLLGGILIAALGSRLTIPDSIYKFIVFMLLMKVGLKGGMAIGEADLAAMLLPALFAAVMGCLIVLIGRFTLAKLPGIRTEDGIATAGLFGAYPVSGSFSRSAVNISAGARTGFSSVVTGSVVAITLLFLTPLLYHLPQAVLAAVMNAAMRVAILPVLVTPLFDRVLVIGWEKNSESDTTGAITTAFDPIWDRLVFAGAISGLTPLHADGGRCAIVVL